MSSAGCGYCTRLCICVYLQHVKQEQSVFPAHMTQTLPSRARRVIRNVSLSFAFFVAVHPNC